MHHCCSYPFFRNSVRNCWIQGRVEARAVDVLCCGLVLLLSLVLYDSDRLDSLPSFLFVYSSFIYIGIYFNMYQEKGPMIWCNDFETDVVVVWFYLILFSWERKVRLKHLVFFVVLFCLVICVQFRCLSFLEVWSVKETCCQLTEQIKIDLFLSLLVLSLVQSKVARAEPATQIRALLLGFFFSSGSIAK